MSQDARFDDEQSTLKRARILGLPISTPLKLPIKFCIRISYPKMSFTDYELSLFKQTQIQLLLVLLIQHPKQQYPASNNDF